MAEKLPTTAARCVFCERIDRRQYAETGFPDVVSFEPLNPVTPGHRLFVPTMHYEDATGEPQMTGTVFAAAASYGRFWKGHDFNLITSVGPMATQTIRHLHVHYVPRRADDGLPLPWTPQQEAARG